jgi:HEAT repeat protein
VAETAVTIVGNYGIKQAVEPLLRIVQGNDIFGTRRSLRVKAIRALGEIGDPPALSRLQRFFRDSILPWPSKEERYAAWESLSGYPHEARAELVERGLRSRDMQVRQISQRLSQS